VSAVTVWVCDGCGKHHEASPRWPTLPPDTLQMRADIESKRSDQPTTHIHACGSTCMAKALMRLAQKLDAGAVAADIKQAMSSGGPYR